jgi:hypothetical protein
MNFGGGLLDREWAKIPERIAQPAKSRSFDDDTRQVRGVSSLRMTILKLRTAIVTR